MMITSAARPADSSDEDQVNRSSSPSSSDEGSDLMSAAMRNEVTRQLVTSGPVGVAAAAAIVSSKKKRKNLSFETNPAVRKRLQTRLLTTLRRTVEEFAARVGQQAVVLIAMPGTANTTTYKVFGAKPLEDVVRNLKSIVMEELECALAHQVPLPAKDPTLFELPPLIIDGIPTPVEKINQRQLRAFIPLMMKYSTGRGKPGWGRESQRPPWWPKEMPFANIRIDRRSEEEKEKYSWTEALRQLIYNCYKYHGRLDLLEEFTPQREDTITIPDGSMNLVQVNPENPIITLPDELPENSGAVQTISEEGDDASNSVTEATINSDGQIILDGDVNGVITVPVSTSMYQSMVANIRHLHTTADGMLYVTPVEANAGDTMGTLTVGPTELTTFSVDLRDLEGLGLGLGDCCSGNDPPQFFQILSSTDATVLAKGVASTTEVKAEETVISGWESST